MHIIYIDSSKDEKTVVHTAIAVPVETWRSTFNKIKAFRKKINEEYGIFIYKELHAWKFVSGRGKISSKIVTKYQRSIIFNEIMDLIESISDLKIFNALGPKNKETMCFEWLLNRINRSLKEWKSHGILVCDEGNEASITRQVRRLSVYNPMPSRFGIWVDSGEKSKNIPLEYIVEDPVFKHSDKSYFIQLCDFVAYALLRCEDPIPSKTKYGYHESFKRLDSVLAREATKKDPKGIIRV